MQQQAAPKSCGVAATCLPKLTSMERHMITSGPQQVAVIEDCACTAEASRCQRVPSDVVYFPGTPFEKVVDVGVCSGPCHPPPGNRASLRNIRLSFRLPFISYLALLTPLCTSKI